MADPARARRLAVRIRQVVADVLEREVKDPRLGFVTVTDARVTSDLAEATVFYTVYGDDAERVATDEALQSAVGMLRREVGRRLGIKTTPTLALVNDEVPDRVRQFDEVLERARRDDEERARLAVGAAPAGEADPYRRPREPDPDDGPMDPSRQAWDGVSETTGDAAPSPRETS